MLKYKDKETGKWVYVPTNLSAEALDLIKEIEEDVGDISQLNTDDKSDVVSAINEISLKENTRQDLIVIAAYNSSPEDKEVANIVLSRNDDASKVIKEALDKMEGVQGTVLLKDGDYLVRSTLIIKNNNKTILKGESHKVIISPIVDSQNDWENPFNQKKVMVYVGGRSVVQNIRFSGDTSSDILVAIMVEGEGILEGCALYNTGKHGIEAGEASLVENCEVHNIGFVGIAADNYAKVSNCKILHSSMGVSLSGFSEGAHLHIEEFEMTGLIVSDSAVASHCKVKMPRNTTKRHGGFTVRGNATLSRSSVIGFNNEEGVGISQTSDFKGLCVFNLVRGAALSPAPGGVTEYNVVV